MEEVMEELDGDFPEAAVASRPASRLLPFTFAKQHGILLQDGHIPTVLHRDALTVPLLAELRRYVGGPFELEQVNEDTFQSRLTQLYQRDNNEASQVAEHLSDDMDLSRLADEIPEVGDLMDAEDDAPIIRLINAILSQAVREQASDIHIETFEERLSVRFRIDGVLSEVLSPKRMLAPLLVSRLKVMAKLDIAEKRVPQDGRISVRIAGHAVDIRMSTIPSAYGERVVLRERADPVRRPQGDGQRAGLDGPGPEALDGGPLRPDDAHGQLRPPRRLGRKVGIICLKYGKYLDKSGMKERKKADFFNVVPLTFLHSQKI